jgi:hypothetical protein
MDQARKAARMMEMEWIWASSYVQEQELDESWWRKLSEEWEVLIGPCPNDFGPTCDAVRSDIGMSGMFELPVGRVECKARRWHEHPHIGCWVDEAGFWDERRVLQVRKWKAPKSELFVAKDGT